MPKFRIEGKVYEALNSEDAYAQHASSNGANSLQKGRSMPEMYKKVLAAGQGLTQNFLDELVGNQAVEDAVNTSQMLALNNKQGDIRTPQDLFSQRNAARDTIRGATTQYEQDNPLTSLGMNLVGAVPTMIFGGGIQTSAKALAKLLAIAKPAAAYTTVSSVGKTEKTDLPEIAKDAAIESAESIALGGGLKVGTGVLSAAGRRIGAAAEPYISKLKPLKSSANLAMQRLATLLARDEAASKFGTGDLNRGIRQSSSRLESIGEEAPLALTGKNTMRELDLLINLPGSAEEATAIAARKIQAGRGDALVTGAATALKNKNVDFNATLKQITDNQKKLSKPFYDQLEDISFVADDKLINLINRSAKAHGGAEELALVSGINPLDLAKITAGKTVSFKTLNTLKKSLWDIEQGAKGEFGKATERSKAYSALRRQLTDKLDELSPVDKETGKSIYKLARSTFESGAQTEAALLKGQNSLKTDLLDLPSIMEDLSPSELSAFRTGVGQAIKQLTGSQPGQTTLLKVTESPALKEKLRLIFGSDYSKFKKTILQQRELKQIERVGGGSQTFKRLKQDEDQSALMDVAEAAVSVKSGNPQGIISSVLNKIKKVQMPEEARNKLTAMLLAKGSKAQDVLKQLDIYNKQQLLKQGKSGRRIGATSAVTTQNIQEQ